MTTVGEGVVPIKADFGPFNRDLNQAESGIGSRLGSIGKTAAVAFAAVGAAAVVGATKSLTAFVGFERKMNEVFTLLPGISQGAMDDMTGQVKNFSKEFGVLPDEVVPALYQSLSAGVPQDNVFEFLETAQKAARGGVTELETAVNGITGVVNAYGADVIDAATASDLMFTTVKLGKTTFDELSASLGDVTPLAGALGVSFEEVSAAMAASTAITGNTAKSATGLKSLLAELGKEGQIAADNFKEIAGESFPDFIKGGGNLADALGLMKDAADESGSSVVDMFGGIEAGSAALQLAGSETFVSNLGAMEESAGATEAAFDQMNKGLGPVFDRIKANLQVFLIDVGERLAPIVEGALEKVGAAFKTIGPIVSQVVGILFRGDFKSGPFSEDSKLVDTLFDIRDAFIKVAGIAKQVFGILFLEDFKSGPLSEDSGIVDALFDIREGFENLIGFIVDDVLPTFVDLGKWVIKHKPVLIGLGVAVGGALVAAFVAWAASATAAAVATLAAAAPLIAIGAAVGLVVAALVYAYNEWDIFRDVIDAVVSFLTDVAWPAIQDFAVLVIDAFSDVVGYVSDHWGDISEAVGHAVAVITDIIESMVAFVSKVWETWGDELIAIAKTVWGLITGSVENGIKVVQGIIETVVAIINGDWGDAWDGIKKVLAAVWDQMFAIVDAGIKIIKAGISGVIDTLKLIWDSAWSTIKRTLTTAWEGIKEVVRTGIRFVVDTFLGMVETVIRGAAFAFSWVPGLGGKLDSAAKSFADFRDDVNLALGGINDKTVNVRLQLQTDKNAQLALQRRTYGVDGLASGVQNWKGGIALVGEEGPELVNLPRGSDVLDAHGTSMAMRDRTHAAEADTFAASPIGATFETHIYNPTPEPVSTSVQRLRRVAFEVA